jgi:hypothetical protein
MHAPRFQRATLSALLCLTSACLAAPTGHDDAPVPTGSLSGNLSGADGATIRAWEGTSRAASNAPSAVRDVTVDQAPEFTSTRRRGTLPEALFEVAGRAGTPSDSSERRAAVVPVDENPTVELTDVVQSVARSAAQSVPWLRMRFPQQRKDAIRPSGPGADASQEGVERAQFDLYGQSAKNREAELRSASARGPRVNLMQDAVQLLRDVFGHPLTWLMATVLVIGALVASIATGRAK